MSIKKDEISSEFEVLFAQLARLQPESSDKVGDLQVKLNDLVHSKCRDSYFESKRIREYYGAIKSFRHNNSLVITKPDKVSGIVILDFQEYINNNP